MKNKSTYSLRNYLKELILGPLFKVIEVIFELFTPILIGFIVDNGIEKVQNQENNGYLYILVPGLMIVLFTILGFCSTLVCQRFASIASQGYGTDLRNRAFRRIQSLSLKEIEIFGVANLTNTVINDTNRLQLAVAMMIRLIIRAPILVIGSVIMSLIISWKIGLIVLGIVTLISIILTIIMVLSSKGYLKVQSDVDNLTDIIKDDVSGLKVIKSFNKTDYEINKFDKANELYFKDMKKLNYLNALTNPISLLIINVGIALVIYFATKNALSGSDMTHGVIMSITQYLNQILVAILVVANLIVIFTRALSSKKRIDLLLAQEGIHNEEKVSIKKDDSKPILEFKDVSFRYKESGNYVIKNINLVINSNETIGIIGGTGSGKSTVVKLLNRLSEPSDGEIKFYGKNIKNYDLRKYRDEISIISQKSALFKGTVKSNMLMGKKDATDEEIIEALKASDAYKFVKRFEDGINHEVLENGKNFSGGEKQRLSIARSIIKPSSIIVADDSLSALDNLTKKLVFENILALNKTKIIISQNTKLLRHCDKIAVLYHGEIIAFDTHDNLLENCNVYKEIYDSEDKLDE